MSQAKLTPHRAIPNGALGLGGAERAAENTAAENAAAENAAAENAAGPNAAAADLPASFDPSDWGSVRDQFALNRDHLQFGAYYMASHPAPVARAVARYAADLDRDTAIYVEEFAEHDKAARAAAASYMGGEPENIALTDSTTMGLGLLYAGLRFKPGQEALTTEHDFYATTESLRLRAARDDITVRTIRLYDDPAKASVDEMVSRLRDAVTSRTRVVALTWVYSNDGVTLPVREVASMLAEVGAGRDEDDRPLLCVDAVHGFGALADTPADLGCDFFVSGTHKWLFGPRGTGVVWGRGEAWPYVDPIIPAFCEEGLVGWWTGKPPTGPMAVVGTPGGFHTFEHRWALPEAFAFHRAIGPERVAARTVEQATRLKEGLAELPHVRLRTPADPAISAGLVCCHVDGMAPDEVGRWLLAEHGIVAGATPYGESCVRFGPSIVTTPDEVDVVVGAMAELG